MGKLKQFAIWQNHKIIGYREMTQEEADKLNGTQMEVYYGKDADCKTCSEAAMCDQAKYDCPLKTRAAIREVYPFA